MIPQREPCGQSFLVSEPMLCSLIHISQSPQLRSSPTKQGGNIWSPSTEPHVDGSSTYIGVGPGFPRRSYTTMLLLPECHEAFSTITTLAWVHENPVNQRES
jgi:hypothetical protein